MLLEEFLQWRHQASVAFTLDPRLADRVLKLESRITGQVDEISVVEGRFEVNA